MDQTVPQTKTLICWALNVPINVLSSLLSLSDFIHKKLYEVGIILEIKKLELRG